MVFNSIPYALFLPIVLGLYWLLHRKAQNVLLLIASYVFYAWWDYRFLAFMWFSTITDYTVGRWLGSTTDERKRKRIFAISLLVNLGILGFFKYFNFFADSAAEVLRAFGLEPDVPTLKLILPIGISFYTFHGISYTFDVYRRDIEPERNFLDFACFIAYFPQLVAGPIGRAQIQLPQFANPRQKPSRYDVRSGVFLILLGLFKKVAIADVLAPYVQDAFHSPGSTGWAQLLVGMYGFAFQVYGDFSGYSDMARGTSRLFGIELLRNFEQPFLSRSMTELWRTWHISLSTWLRDYVYLPLGGSRVGRYRGYANTMILMLVAGLWHGAAWTFVAWGALNGLFLIAERIASDRRPKSSRDTSTPIGGPVGTLPIDARHETAVEASAVKTARRKEAPLPPPVRSKDVVAVIRTFTLFCVAAVFFRAESFTGAWQFLTGIVTLRAGPLNANAAALLIFAAIFSFAIDIMQRNTRDETPVIEWVAPARAAAYAILFVAVLIFSGNTPTPFIYFNF